MLGTTYFFNGFIRIGEILLHGLLRQNIKLYFMESNSNQQFLRNLLFFQLFSNKFNHVLKTLIIAETFPFSENHATQARKISHSYLRSKL